MKLLPQLRYLIRLQLSGSSGVLNNVLKIVVPGGEHKVHRLSSEWRVSVLNALCDTGQTPISRCCLYCLSIVIGIDTMLSCLWD
jgi:hypothetical protein